MDQNRTDATAATVNETEDNNNDNPAKEFLKLWESGASDARAKQRLKLILKRTELVGSVIYGTTDDPQFGKTLHTSKWRRLCWVFGPDALPDFLGLSAWEICIKLGFGEDWINDKLSQNYVFKMSIFPSTSVAAVPATWNGLQQRLMDVYDSVWLKISDKFQKLQAMTIQEIQAQSSYDMKAAHDAGRIQDGTTGESTSEYYMSIQRLECIDNPTLVQVRQFLWDEVNCNNLYAGDGYTRDDNGNKGYAEYLAKQMLFVDIDGSEILDLSVEAPKKDLKTSETNEKNVVPSPRFCDFSSCILQ